MEEITRMLKLRVNLYHQYFADMSNAQAQNSLCQGSSNESSDLRMTSTPVSLSPKASYLSLTQDEVDELKDITLPAIGKLISPLPPLLSPMSPLTPSPVRNNRPIWKLIPIDIYSLPTQSRLYETAPNTPWKLIPIDVNPISSEKLLETNGVTLADTPLHPTDKGKRKRFRGCPTLRVLKANQPGVLIKCPRKKLFPKVYTNVPIEKLCKMALIDTLQNMTLLSLKLMANEHGLKRYSKFKKADLIAFLHDNNGGKSLETLSPPPQPPMDKLISPLPPLLSPMSFDMSSTPLSELRSKAKQLGLTGYDKLSAIGLKSFISDVLECPVEGDCEPLPHNHFPPDIDPPSSPTPSPYAL